MRFIFRLLLVLGLILPIHLEAQSTRHLKKERKRIWRRWRSHREAYNPYLDKKAKNKPSARLAREEKRELKRQKRQFKRETRRAKRHKR